MSGIRWYLLWWLSAFGHIFRLVVNQFLIRRNDNITCSLSWHSFLVVTPLSDQSSQCMRCSLFFSKRSTGDKLQKYEYIHAPPVSDDWIRYLDSIRNNLSPGALLSENQVYLRNMQQTRYMTTSCFTRLAFQIHEFDGLSVMKIRLDRGYHYRTYIILTYQYKLSIECVSVATSWSWISTCATCESRNMSSVKPTHSLTY